MMSKTSFMLDGLELLFAFSTGFGTGLALVVADLMLAMRSATTMLMMIIVYF